MGRRDAEKMKNSQWRGRPLDPRDQDFLWDMLYIALWDAPDEERRPRSVLQDPRIRRLVEHWGRPDDFGLIALDRETGESAGAIWARLDRYDQIEEYGCEYPFIGIAVTETHQGRGVGTFLMSQYLNAVGEKVPGLRLGVNPRNQVAIGLYRKFGFKEYAIGARGYPQMKLVFSKK